MKLISCGCSFFTLDKRYPKTHFSELIAQRGNYELENYGKLGASNFTIALQVEHAIKQNPDILLIGFTSVDRIEIPVDQYRIPDGILNIKYNTNNVFPPYYDERLTTTVSNSFPNLEQTDAVKLYISDLYDPELKRQHDFFIAAGILRKLDKLNIPYVFTRGGLTGPDWSEWAHNEVDYETACPWHWTDGAPVYHTSIIKQQELAELWLSKIKELNL